MIIDPVYISFLCTLPDGTVWIAVNGAIAGVPDIVWDFCCISVISEPVIICIYDGTVTCICDHFTEGIDIFRDLGGT